jgi:predicted anti-sigma-YlaC factor YlaD
VQSKLSAYLDGELTGQEMFCIRDHLNRCPPCREELCSLKGLKRLIGEIACPEPSKGFETRLAASVTAERPQAPFWPFRSTVLFVGVAGLTMVATLEVLSAFGPAPATTVRTDTSRPRAGIDFELNSDAMAASMADPISGSPIVPVVATR